jgi:hypothetical protein
VKKPRLKLADGTRLGSKFSQLVWDALERREINHGVPHCPIGWVRVRTSWGSLYDCPPAKVWWLATAKQLDPGMTIVDSRKFQETDRQVFATLRLMFRAAQNLDDWLFR